MIFRGARSAMQGTSGDGFDYVIVGAIGAHLNGNLSGSSYVVFGKGSSFDATLDLSSLDGSNGFRLDREDKYDNSDRSLSNAGDVNGDGFDDLIAGAFRADPNGYASGSSYVLFGRSDFSGGDIIEGLLGMTFWWVVVKMTSLTEMMEMTR